MSGFLHKVENIFPGHHHHDSTSAGDQSHGSTSTDKTKDNRPDIHHHHHESSRENAHNRSQAERDRADFLADRQYDRDVRSPQRGPGIGFEE
ncbi:hypothetical protein BDV59DRAFT_35419 [Aspergillus ambiguus]|uniref:uncharacterized protein n=1 Tax=Aspergillus ambiguus TaxID=176160 RepID=UPI003CCD7D1D